MELDLNFLFNFLFVLVDNKINVVEITRENQ